LKNQQEASWYNYPSSFSLGELRSFEQKLALLVRVKLSAFHHDIESLSVGVHTHMLSFLGILGWDSLENLFQMFALLLVGLGVWNLISKAHVPKKNHGILLPFENDKQIGNGHLANYAFLTAIEEENQRVTMTR
jgi:hypothetical protein